MKNPLLSVQGVSSGYGDVPVLAEINLDVLPSEVVAVVGANGAGKTTLLRTIAGLIRATSGSVRFDGADLTAEPPHDVVSKGLVTVPEGGKLFPFMTVLENLEVGAYSSTARPLLRQTLDEVMELFPRLAERKTQLAGSLSGGERQMCAIARAVMSQPRLLMLDEPSLGLSPQMVERVLDIVSALVARKNLTVLLVEQNVSEALEIAARAYVLDRGRIVRSGIASELSNDRQIQETYMGL